MSTSTTRRTRCTAAALAMTLAGALGVGLVGTAASAAPANCARGDAESVLQAGIQGFAKRLAGHPERGMVHSTAHCQVQLSLDGAHYTFTEGDVFALQNTFFGPWRCWFAKPRESVADYELLGERAWIAPVVNGVAGPAAELELSMTPVKTVAFTESVPGMEECFSGPATQVHYRTIGTIPNLAPGDYQTTYEASYVGELFYTATVMITVTD